MFWITLALAEGTDLLFGDTYEYSVQNYPVITVKRHASRG